MKASNRKNNWRSNPGTSVAGPYASFSCAQRSESSGMSPMRSHFTRTLNALFAIEEIPSPLLLSFGLSAGLKYLPCRATAAAAAEPNFRSHPWE